MIFEFGLFWGIDGYMRDERHVVFRRRFLFQRADVTAAEVLGNINAMNAAVHELGPGDPITPDTLLGFHRLLMANSRLSAQAGRLREQQNWIGALDEADETEDEAEGLQRGAVPRAR